MRFALIMIYIYNMKRTLWHSTWQSRLNRLKDLANALIIAYEMTQHIVVDILGIRCLATRRVPKDLTFVRNHHHWTVAEKLISEAKNDSTFMKLKIRGDET